MYQINCYLENGDKMVYPIALKTKREAECVVGALSLDDDYFGIENEYEIIEIDVDKTSKI